MFLLTHLPILFVGSWDGLPDPTYQPTNQPTNRLTQPTDDPPNPNNTNSLGGQDGAAMEAQREGHQEERGAGDVQGGMSGVRRAHHVYILYVFIICIVCTHHTRNPPSYVTTNFTTENFIHQTHAHPTTTTINNFTTQI